MRDGGKKMEEWEEQEGQEKEMGKKRKQYYDKRELSRGRKEKTGGRQ